MSPPEDQEPDYRFTLANERTYLAYLRTALACYAGGLSAVQFLRIDGQQWLTKAIGLVLLVAGTATSAGGFRRWRANQAAMRRGDPLPPTRLPLMLGATIGTVGLVGVVFALLR